MKFRVTMKDPDTLHTALREAIEREVAKLELDPDEAETLQDKRMEKYCEICSRWFRYSEYLTVEIDTSEGTCFVVEDAR